jgi:hypothetical protein
MQERGENIPAEESFDVARRIKEMYCYTSSDIVKVFKCLVMFAGGHMYFALEEHFLRNSEECGWNWFSFALHGNAFCLKYCISAT